MSHRVKGVLRILMILVGNFLDALGFVLFVSATGLITGGSSGVGLLFHRAFGVPTSVVIYIVNFSMLILGWFVFGKRFAFQSILSSFMYPTAMLIIEHFVQDRVITQDIFLCTIMGGILIGLGVGLVLRAGASSGGMDVPALMMNKYLKIPLSASVYMIDIAILLLQALQTPGDNVLYGIVLVLVYSTMIEKVSLIGRSRVEVQVISEKSDEIKDAILADLDRVVTLLKGVGGYSGNEVDVVMSVISSRQLSRVELIVHEVDPRAFMVVKRVSAVVGEGFTYPAPQNQNPSEE